MSKASLTATAATLFLFTLPAFAQQPGADFPEGPGKQTVVDMCGACHDINRVRAGYTPEGWRTVMRMMLNFNVPVPKDQVETVTDAPPDPVPGAPRSHRIPACAGAPAGALRRASATRSTPSDSTTTALTMSPTARCACDRTVVTPSTSGAWCAARPW